MVQHTERDTYKDAKFSTSQTSVAHDLIFPTNHHTIRPCRDRSFAVMGVVTEVQNDNNINGHDTETKSTSAEPDWANLRRVPDKLPKVALLILAVEVRETSSTKLWHVKTHF